MKRFRMLLKAGISAIIFTASMAAATPSDGSGGPAVILLVDADSYNLTPGNPSAWRALHCRKRDQGAHCRMRDYSIGGDNKSGYEFNVYGFQHYFNGIFLNGILDYSQVFLSVNHPTNSSRPEQFINCPVAEGGNSSTVCMLKSHNFTVVPNDDRDDDDIVELYFLMTNQTYQDNRPLYRCNGVLCNPEEECKCCNNVKGTGIAKEVCYELIHYRQTPFLIRNNHIGHTTGVVDLSQVMNCKWASDGGEGTGNACRMVPVGDCEYEDAQCKPQFFIAVVLRPYPKCKCPSTTTNPLCPLSEP